MNQNSKMLAEFVNEINIEKLNETLADEHVIWSTKNHEPAFDYMLVNGTMHEVV